MGVSVCPKCDVAAVIYASDFVKPGIAVYHRALLRDDAGAEGAEDSRNRLQVASHTDNARRQPFKPDGNVNTPDDQFSEPSRQRSKTITPSVVDEPSLNHRANTFVDKPFMKTLKTVDPKYEKDILKHSEAISRQPARTN